MSLSRKTSSLVSFVLALCLTALAAPAVNAAAPAAPAPTGFFRTTVGSYDVTALSDGIGAIGASLLHGDQALIASMLKEDYLDPVTMPVPVNAYLINTGTKLILVDTGTGGNWGPASLGRMIDNMKAAGYRPAQVDLVLITHLHPDHVGGLVGKDGKALFPKAVIRMSQADSDFWLSRTIEAAAPEAAHVFFDVAQKGAAPYLRSGKWKPFHDGESVDAAVTVVALPGHTPGHVGYQFQSGGQTLLVWGDVVQAVSVQMAHPEIAIDFDSDAPMAVG